MPAGRFKPIYNQRPETNPRLARQLRDQEKLSGGAGGKKGMVSRHKPADYHSHRSYSPAAKSFVRTGGQKPTLNDVLASESPRLRAVRAAQKKSVIDAQLRHQQIKSAGINPGAILHRAGTLYRSTSKAVQAIPSGVAMGATAGYSDVSHGRVTFPATRKYGEEIGKSFVETAKHPYRNPGATLTTLLGGAGIGSAALERAGLVSRTAGESELAIPGSKIGKGTWDPLRVTVTHHDRAYLRPATKYRVGYEQKVAYIPKRDRVGIQKLINPEKRAGRLLREAGRIEESTGHVEKANDYVLAKLWNVGHNQKQGISDIPIRISKDSQGNTKFNIPAKVGIRKAKTPYGQAHSVESLDKLGPTGRMKLGMTTGQKVVPSQVQNIRWVNKDLLPGHHIQELIGGKGGTVGGIMKPINTLFRTLQVYARPGYIATNRPQNELMGVLQHGHKYIAQRINSHVHADPELSQDISHAMGTARTGSYAMGEIPQNWYQLGKGGALLRGATHFEGKVIHKMTDWTDKAPREALFRVRAAEKGFKTNEEVKALLHDPKFEKERIQITHRAREDGVNFDSMTPQERGLANLIYFYPWITRATRWSGRYAVNHPAAVAGLYQMGMLGEPGTNKLPEWARGYVGGKHGISGFSSMNTLATPFQTIDPYAEGSKGLTAFSFGAETGTPALQLASMNWNSDAQRKRLLRSIGLAAAVERGFNWGQAKTFRERGGIGRAFDVGGPFVLGAPYPRLVRASEVKKQLSRGRGRAHGGTSHNDYFPSENSGGGGYMPSGGSSSSGYMP